MPFTHGNKLQRRFTFADDHWGLSPTEPPTKPCRDPRAAGFTAAGLALAAGVLDELELHVVPVLFGQGRRLFEGLAAEQIELERILEGNRHALPGPASRYRGEHE